MGLNRFAIDITPLRISSDFRSLFIARTISLLSVGILSVAVNIQVFELTKSSFYVGLISLCLAIPMMAGLLVGGLLADSFDRRKIMIWTRTCYIGIVAIFLLNSAAEHPRIWIIYVAASVAGLINGLSTPPMMAAMPALAGREHLLAAGALTTVTTQLGAVIGPSLAGAIAAAGGFTACYAFVAVGVVLTPIFLLRLRPMPPGGGPPPGGVTAIAEGLHFVRGNSLIGALLLIDVGAAVFATPQALFPEIGTQRFGGGPSIVGLLYTAPAAGALIGALLSGWINHLERGGRALIIAVLSWGGAMIAFGLSTHLAVALFFLGVGGFANTTSEILRRGLLQQYTPDSLQGRVGSLWLMQAIIGPSAGNAQAGFVGSLLSPSIAITAGGAICVGGTIVIASAFPILRHTTMLEHAGPQRRGNS